ncbi:hypothetical protein PVK06_039797 [Gossypium arboreum]|uniref:Serine/threonine-protein phosphatase 7 long form homolog n=1 Tax=Gossypium arboreum TaxID=29729 RepID=A0ABR0N5Z9_GOSAR|nr:hypothetical protein PVK06_039797 [Gossypium arboreum]
MFGHPSPLIENYLREGGILAHGHDRPRVQVGPETNQCVDREVETRDSHFSSSMRRVYYHFGRRAFSIGITGGWVPLVNYATVEMHQSNRVLWQFGFQQPIPEAPEVFDDKHKVNLRQLHTDWLRFWSHYIEMWENRYDYIPTPEPIIVLELASYRIHAMVYDPCKSYLLSEEETRQQIRAQREHGAL